MLNRNMSAATGVSAATAPATSAAAGENQRLTAAYRMPTIATPSRACGARIDHELTPKMRAEIAIGQIDSGVLSIVMKFDESVDP